MNTKIKRVEEEQVMKDGKVIAINYTVWYFNAKRRDYRNGHYKVIPMTVLNFILDEGNEAVTRYQEFDGCLYKRTMYQQEVKTDDINMTTAQEDINDAIRFGWIEAPAQEATLTTETAETTTTAHPAPAKLAKEYNARTHTNRDKWQRPRLNGAGSLHNSITWRYYHGAGTPRT